MTDHPITPPPELVHQWADMLASGSGQAVFAMVAQWGADQELKECGALMDKWGLDGPCLLECRRPKPPSLRELALASVKRFEESGEFFSDQMRELEFIRRALEALPE
jgi:hypothetical protein